MGLSKPNLDKTLNSRTGTTPSAPAAPAATRPCSFLLTMPEPPTRRAALNSELRERGVPAPAPAPAPAVDAEETEEEEEEAKAAGVSAGGCCATHMGVALSGLQFAGTDNDKSKSVPSSSRPNPAPAKCWL